MPSTMIHLLVAHAIEPDAPGSFWIGNFAPDYTNDRALKDEIHLRNVPDRWASLAKLKDGIDRANPFERGWLLHLFADACWDETHMLNHKRWFEANNAADNWFLNYREEIGFATYYLYHQLPWSQAVWAQIKEADLNSLNTTLPIPLEGNEWYRDRVYIKHTESDPANTPRYFTMDMLNAFAESTSAKYKYWVGLAPA